LGYPFVEEGNVIIVQKALGQQNIDDLLKLSDEYKKSAHPRTPTHHHITKTPAGELEIIAARSSAGDIVEERIVEERHTEYVNVASPHEHVEFTQQQYTQQHPSGALVVTATPPAAAPLPPPPAPAPVPVFMAPQPNVQYAPQPTAVQYAPEPQVQFARNTMVREVSPARSYTTTASYTTGTTASYTTGTSSTVTGPVIVDAYPSHHHHGQELVRAPPQEIVLPRRSRSRHHSRHGSRDLVRAERLSTGELVLYEEEVEHVEPTRNGVRIEKDKRGRMSISVPRNR